MSIFTLFLFIALAVGILMVLFGLPGTWLIVAAALGYAQVADFGLPGRDYRVVALLVFLALLAEAFEFIVSIVGAKRLAVSNGAIVASFVGAFVGGIAGSTFMPLVGSLIGVFSGAFLAAFIYELALQYPLMCALKTAMAVLISRIVAVFFKTVIALAMAGVIIWKILVHF